MTDEDWAARLWAFDRHREAHARMLDTFRAQLEAARRMLDRVMWQMERNPRATGTWSSRTPRAELRGRPRLPEPGLPFVAGEVDR